MRDIFKANESYEAEDFSLSEFSSCFQLGRLVDKREITEKVGSETSIDSLCIVESKTPNARSMLKFFSFLATKASQDFDMAKTTLIEAKIEGNLLESALSCLVAANANELEHIHSNQMVIQSFHLPQIISLYKFNVCRSACSVCFSNYARGKISFLEP